MRRWVVAAGVVATASVAGEARGQAAVQDGERALRLQRAEILADQAMVIANQKRDFARASSLMQEAAALRGHDAGAVDALVKAGHYSWYAGRRMSAVSAFRRAGEAAVAIGDRTAAAGAFMNGAWVAAREGEWATARELAARSRTLGVTMALPALGGAPDR